MRFQVLAKYRDSTGVVWYSPSAGLLARVFTRSLLSLGWAGKLPHVESSMVIHPGILSARRCLTSVIRGELVRCLFIGWRDVVSWEILLKINNKLIILFTFTLWPISYFQFYYYLPVYCCSKAWHFLFWSFSISCEHWADKKKVMLLGELRKC